jgi:hypothetical protein
MRLKASKTVHLLNPLEVLNVANSVADIESVMLDQVHLLSGATICWRTRQSGLWRDGRLVNASRTTAGPRTQSSSNLGRVRAAMAAERKAVARKVAAVPSNRAVSPAASAGYGGFKKW